MRKIVIGLFFLIMLLFLVPLVALADLGDGNIDGGGGGVGKGSSSNKWSLGHDGVRVTVIRDSNNSPVTTPIDYTNIIPANNLTHFGKVSKIGYRTGVVLSPQVKQYTYLRPSVALPRIISTTSNPERIKAIKKYFCSEYAAKMIAHDTGMAHEDLISGDYKLLLEPIAYVTFNGAKVGFTATEAALYDMVLGGGLCARLPSTSHKNLPLAMFLEVSDLGYPAWNGPADKKVSNDQIISSLGLGIVRYNEPPDLEVEAFDYEYRTNTEVITPVTLSTGSRLMPDNPGRVTFFILGSSYTVSNIVIPEGGSQVVWCKWRTPATPQMITIKVSASGGRVSNSTIKAKIVDLNENETPNPTANDRNDSFSLPAVPSKPQQRSASWSVWRCYWVPLWEQCWHTDADGEEWYHWIDNGDWEYDSDTYSASLSASGRTSPDEKAVTASGKTMKSGYGINIEINARVSSNAPGSHTTWAQTAVSYFPEFSYDTYWRLHDRVVSGYNATLSLKPNIYSTYNRRAHFTPVWFPNGVYTTYTQVLDAWTPAGMLSMNVTDYVNISESVFADWHIAPKN